MYQLLWWANDGHQLSFNAPKLMRDPYLQKSLKTLSSNNHHHYEGKSELFSCYWNLARFVKF